MLDKIELRVPGRTPFRTDFQWIEKELPYAGQCSTIRRSIRYQGVVDLRACGLDALLHARFKRASRGPHKLELLRTGKKSLAEMAEIVSKVFDFDPSNAETMRLDFAADLHGVPVTYLHERLRVKFKRTTDERGQLDYEKVGRHRLEYFRYGMAPNCVRVYDKVAECKARLSEHAIRIAWFPVRRPTFEQAFGFSPDATITRVERQAGGGRIPPRLSTFGELRRADRLNPFVNVEIITNTATIPAPERYGESAMLKLLGVQALIDRYGLQSARAILNRNGNAKRYLDAYAEFARQCEAEFHVTGETLFETYRDSVCKQIDGTVSRFQAFCDSVKNRTEGTGARPDLSVLSSPKSRDSATSPAKIGATLPNAIQDRADYGKADMSD